MLSPFERDVRRRLVERDVEILEREREGAGDDLDALVDWTRANIDLE